MTDGDRIKLEPSWKHALRAEFARIQAAVKEEFDWLYGTTCDRCHGPATIQPGRPARPPSE